MVEGSSMLDDASMLLERITEAFARGDEALGHELVAEAIERHEMPAETVAAALSAGVEAQFARPTRTR
jgi:hypothetical protein